MLDGLPKSVRIAGKDFEIRVKDDMGDAFGVYRHNECAIEIDTKIPNIVLAANVLIHELMHGVYDAWELRPGDKEERVVSAMSNGWTQVARDNPELMKWIANALNTTQSPTPGPQLQKLIEQSENAWQRAARAGSQSE